MNTPNQALSYSEARLKEFSFRVNELETAAAEGIETYKGVRTIEFRAGLEIEFNLHTPDDLESRFASASSVPEHMISFAWGQIINPEAQAHESHDGTIEDFRGYAAEFIHRLQPSNQQEESLQELWLSQVESMGIKDIFNFLIYEEFSQPQLAIPTCPNTDSPSEVDAYTNENNWIEWRFGPGTMQSGYYDHSETPEIRLTPCQPSELLRRATIVKQRMAEIGNKLGLVVVAGDEMSHIHLSVYEQLEGDEWRSLIGNSEDKSADTIDITSGMLKAHRDGVGMLGVGLFNYGRALLHRGVDNMKVGPVRNNIRVLDGRIELRSHFSDLEQGVSWVIAGATEGLSIGSQALAESRYSVTRLDGVLRVKRLEPEFDKERDLVIQRMLEKSRLIGDGRFRVDRGWARNNGIKLAESLSGFRMEPHSAQPLFASVLASAVRLQDGRPTVSAESLEQAWYELAASDRNALEDAGLSELLDEELINLRFSGLRLVPDTAVVGGSEYRWPQSEARIERMRQATSLQKMLGSQALHGIVDRIRDVYKATGR